MQQQVNFYRFLPQRPIFQLTLESVMTIYFIFFFLLMADYGFDLWQKHKKTNQIAQLSSEWSNQQQKLVGVAAQFASINPQDLQKSMAQLQKNIEINVRMLTQLFGQIRFSDYMLGFAQAAVPGAWLTNIEVKTGEGKIQLHGHAMTAEQAQQYLDGLQQQNYFSDFTFVLQELQQPTGGGSHLTFYITTKGNEAA
jgi:hypothetical protein